MTIQELMNKRANTWDAMKKLLNEKVDEKGMMTAEDAAQYDRMEKEMDELSNQIERQQRAEKMEDAMGKPMRQMMRNEIKGGETKNVGPRGTEAYNTAFWDFMRIGNAAMTPEIRNSLKVGTDANGGYLVPEEFEKTLIEALDEGNIFRQFAHKITTSGDRQIPMVLSRGTAEWIEEEAEYPESDVEFGQTYLRAYKVATRIKISEELMADSAFNMAAFIAKEFGRRIGAAEEQAFFTGNGVGKPTGILHDTGAQIGVTAGAADKITGDEVIDLYYSLRAPYRRKAVFITHDSAMKALRKLKDGNQQYIYQPALTANTPDTLMGRPVHTSQYMPEVASGNKVMMFGDLSHYWIADRAGYSFKRLNELYAANGQIGFIASKRVDGKLLLPEAVKVLKMG